MSDANGCRLFELFGFDGECEGFVLHKDGFVLEVDDGGAFGGELCGFVVAFVGAEEVVGEKDGGEFIVGGSELAFDEEFVGVRAF